jgi:hypothetical protein
MQRRDFLAGMVATPTAPGLTSLLSDLRGGRPAPNPTPTPNPPPAPTPTPTPNPTPTPDKKNFIAWECMRWNNGPSDLAKCGLPRMPIYYQNDLISGENPDYGKLDKVIAIIKANKFPLVTLDIERWNAASAPQREKYIRAIEYVRARVPSTTKLAYYGIMPKNRYGDYIAGGERLAYQQRVNRMMQPLADKVDWIMPCYHAYTSNRQNWAKFAEIVAEEAHKYGKPVMPWLWMQYHELSSDPKIRYQIIPGDFFREQLETAYRLGDSLCLWGTLLPRVDGKVQRATWDPDAAWWQQTKSFLKAKGKAGAATCHA